MKYLERRIGSNGEGEGWERGKRGEGERWVRDDEWEEEE